MHRHRVEGREADILGLQLPTWQNVRERQYEQWDLPRLVVDTAESSIEQAVEAIMQHLSLTSPVS
ncbi:hypothetical protein CEJ98_14170 [Burkholderia gladioli pv. gladioli]|nr:hypothetical protein CEJ98_14170 [Burkholderia gladioli pv. gladioli]AWY54741.1 hypothetical protein A8H28_26960 [Burkholderia gladioli pv. gladioli]